MFKGQNTDVLSSRDRALQDDSSASYERNLYFQSDSYAENQYTQESKYIKTPLELFELVGSEFI